MVVAPGPPRLLFIFLNLAAYLWKHRPDTISLSNQMKKKAASRWLEPPRAGAGDRAISLGAVNRPRSACRTILVARENFFRIHSDGKDARHVMEKQH